MKNCQKVNKELESFRENPRVNAKEQQSYRMDSPQPLEEEMDEMKVRN